MSQPSTRTATITYDDKSVRYFMIASIVWGIVGIAALLEALVLFAVGLRLRHRYVNTVQGYESRGDYLEDDGSNRPRIPLLGDGAARQNITNQGP